MTMPEPMTSCPDDETLAALVDGRLEVHDRARVMAHVADCGDCRFVVLDAADIAREMAPAAAVVQGSFGRRAVVPLLAAAAVLALVFFVTPIRERILGRSAVGMVAEAANHLDSRPTVARFSTGFEYRPTNGMRGAGEARQDDYEILEVSLRVAKRAEEKPTAENLHARGLAEMLRKEQRAAVQTLEQAAAIGKPSSDLLSDLAAAYVARNAEGDAARAVAAAERSLRIERTPMALWNRAVALEEIDERAAAAAWKDYLAIDSKSPWADEARKNLGQPVR